MVNGIVPNKEFRLKSRCVNNESCATDDGTVPHRPQFCRLTTATFQRAVIAVHWLERKELDPRDRNLYSLEDQNYHFKRCKQSPVMKCNKRDIKMAKTARTSVLLLS